MLRQPWYQECDLIAAWSWGDETFTDHIPFLNIDAEGSQRGFWYRRGMNSEAKCLILGFRCISLLICLHSYTSGCLKAYYLLSVLHRTNRWKGPTSGAFELNFIRTTSLSIDLAGEEPSRLGIASKLTHTCHSWQYSHRIYHRIRWSAQNCRIHKPECVSPINIDSVQNKEVLFLLQYTHPLYRGMARTLENGGKYVEFRAFIIADTHHIVLFKRWK